MFCMICNISLSSPLSYLMAQFHQNMLKISRKSTHGRNDFWFSSTRENLLTLNHSLSEYPDILRFFTYCYLDKLFSASFPTRWCGHSLRRWCVRHLQRWPSGLLWGGTGPARGWRCQADGWDGEEAWEGRGHRWHDPRPEVNWTDNQWLNDCLCLFFFIWKKKMNR